MPKTFENRVNASRERLDMEQQNSQKRQQAEQANQAAAQAQQQAVDQLAVLGSRYNMAVRDPAEAKLLYQELLAIGPKLPPDKQKQAADMAAQLLSSLQQ